MGNSESALPLFETMDFFQARIPLLPIHFYEDLVDRNSSCEQLRDKVTCLLKNPIIREAITVANPQFMGSVDYVLNRPNHRKSNKVLRSLIHYLIRLSTRATPYGIFAGVSLGKFEDSSSLIIGNVERHRKIARPDMEWIMNIVQYLEKEPVVVAQLTVVTNPLLYIVGSRAKLPYLNYTNSENNEIKNSSIKATTLVKYVLERAQKPITFAQLAIEIQEKHPETSYNRIVQFITTLLHQEFIISNLRPPISIHKAELPFDYLRKQIEPLNGLDDMKQRLNTVNEQIHQYNKSIIGEGEVLYHRLHENLNRILSTKNPLQVDMEVEIKKVSLNQDVAKQIAKAAEIMWRLSPEPSNPHLASYRNNFIEKYGFHQQVPLLELLDEDAGLGAPPDYKYPESKYRAEQITVNIERNKVLGIWVADAIKSGHNEIELTEERLMKMETPESHLQPPTSLEMFITIATDNKQRSKIIINPNSGSSGAGRTFGRFSTFLNTDEALEFSKMYGNRNINDDEPIMAEIVYLPVNSRHANVAITNQMCAYQIVLGTNISESNYTKTIPLSDLYVGCTNHYFYLISRNLNREVIPTMTNMLNYQHSPNVYRFLREVANERQRNIIPFYWGHLSEFPMLPRIRYQNIVLSLAKWSLNKNVEVFQQCKNSDDWIKCFSEWRAQWNIPRYVYITVADNRLLFDLDNNYFVFELYDKYKSLNGSESLWLTECGFEMKEVWGRGDNGYSIAEYVVPLVSKKTNKSASNQRKIVCPYSSSLGVTKRYFPGREWLYAKLYGMSEREEEFIGKYLKAFCDHAERQHLIKRFFFIRYTDPEPHIRIRFNSNPSELIQKLIPAIHTWAEQLEIEGLLNQITFDTYEPEIYRYGGKEVISLAEEIFSADSKLVAELISIWCDKRNPENLVELAMISVMDILNHFLPSLEEQVKWCQEKDWHMHYSIEFQKRRRDYMALCDASNETPYLEQNSMVKNYIHLRKEKILSYKYALDQNNKRMMLTASQSSILDSLVHMNLNRLLGTNRNQERKIMSLISHSLYHLNNRRKHTQQTFEGILSYDNN
ncbi:lantibiotic dehydratase [Paenibacillus alvei]|uniref:lantibiotic dehydratase n=1 Tax=Paenibacillus alvei TaxID=44250 RepID=UPI0013D9598F|nr:lantibiotic dehydratase [Paenibacillus alvei]NEZ43385.1 lantibiotic dehydratase [Paenibacillus alvei]